MTIQVVLGAKLLKAADKAAWRQNQNRSALIRNVLKEHLGRLHTGVHWPAFAIVQYTVE